MEKYIKTEWKTLWLGDSEDINKPMKHPRIESVRIVSKKSVRILEALWHDASMHFNFCLLPFNKRI